MLTFIFVNKTLCYFLARRNIHSAYPFSFKRHNFFLHSTQLQRRF